MLDVQPPPPAASAQDPPARPLEPSPGTQGLCPGWGMRLSLSHLQVEPVAELRTHARDTETHTGTRTLAWLATDKTLPSTAPTYRIRIHINTDSQVPSSSAAGRGRSLVQACTALSRFTSTHKFADPSSTSTAPLCAQHPCPDSGPSYLLHRSSTHRLVQLNAR